MGLFDQKATIAASPGLDTSLDVRPKSRDKDYRPARKTAGRQDAKAPRHLKCILLGTFCKNTWRVCILGSKLFRNERFSAALLEALPKIRERKPLPTGWRLCKNSGCLTRKKSLPTNHTNHTKYGNSFPHESSDRVYVLYLCKSFIRTHTRPPYGPY